MSNRIILTADEVITCSECGHEFALKDGITRQTIERYQEAFDGELSRERGAMQAQLEKEATRRAARTYESQITEMKDLLEERDNAISKVQQQLNQAKEKAVAEAREESEAHAKALQEEIEHKNDKLREYQKQELTLRQEKKALEEARQEQEIQLQRRLDEEKKRLTQEVEVNYKLREAEYRKKIDDAQKANEELKRKLERGSQQLQGEVLELELESALKSTFPFDIIEEVRKGARGADVIQSVLTRSGTPCGKIIWETKRAENWSNGWITKLKDDQQDANAEIAVLVTTTFPNDSTDPFIMEDGVWIARPYATGALAEALRGILTESQRQKTISLGRNDKADAIYDYLCSPIFAQKIRSVVESNHAMKAELEKEKTAYARIWKKREAQIDRIRNNMMGMCGELQGLSDTSFPQLESFGMLLDSAD